LEDAILRFVRLAYRLRLYREWLDYVIVEGGRDIGRLYEDRHSRRWFWLITVYVNPRLRIATSGRAAIEGAKAQFLANRQKCQEQLQIKGTDNRLQPPRRERSSSVRGK
jgi:hypothetical protein